MSTSSSIRRYTPHTVVFISSMGIMIIELVASRIISKYFGNSLYTWTGIIGIVLGGITLGNYLGGKLADRYPVKKSAPVLLLIASGLILLIIGLDIILSLGRDTLEFNNPVLLVLSAVAVITLLFFLPSTALGTVSPVMAKYALEQSSKIGSTVGNIYAFSAAGSIVGTFLSGFVLIPFLGIPTVIIVVAAVIAFLSLFVRGRKTVVFGWVSSLGVLFILTVAAPVWGFYTLPGSENILYQTDSMYSHIQVKEETPAKRELIMDGLVHNMHDRNNPDNLLYEYERIFESVTAWFAEKGSSGGGLNTLTLGGGALTFPSYLERHYPRGSHHVVEIDPRVIETAHQYFDIPPDTSLLVHVQDARQFVHTYSGKERFDIIYLDVFNSYSIPSHLTTLEFTGKLKELLTEEGILLVNLIDIFSSGRFLGAYTETVEAVFSLSRVYAGVNFNKNSRATFVVLGTDWPYGDVDFETASGETFIPVSDEELADLVRRTNSKPLTDNHAPVEHLIAPVFLDVVR